jgi:hypothetical protein
MPNYVNQHEPLAASMFDSLADKLTKRELSFEVVNQLDLQTLDLKWEEPHISISS